MGTLVGTATVDEKGRIVLPKEIRERFGLQPGVDVIIEAGERGVVVRRAISLREALSRLRGAINPRTVRKGSPPPNAFEYKRMWEPKL